MKFVCEQCGKEYVKEYDVSRDLYRLVHPKNLCVHSNKSHVISGEQKIVW